MKSVTEKHSAMVRRLAKPPREISRGMVDNDVRMHATHAALGLAGEAGEVVDMIKKYAVNGHALNPVKLQEELGDIMFYMHMLIQLTGGNLEDCLEANIDKLGTRYKDGYSDQASILRADVSDEEIEELKEAWDKPSMEEVLRDDWRA